MASPIIHVPAGTLVYFDDIGIQVRADFNDSEFGSQPFVTINTEDLPATHCYGPDDGLPIIAVHLNDAEIYDDMGGGNVAPVVGKPETLIYVVRPNDPSEDTAAFVHIEDAEAFAQTYDSLIAEDVERVTVCGRELTAQMIAERGDQS